MISGTEALKIFLKIRVEKCTTGPIRVAVRSKACDCGRSLAAIAGSNGTGGV